MSPNLDVRVAPPLPAAAMARAAVTFAVVAGVALPIDFVLTIVDAFRDWAPPSECCPTFHARPIWLKILQTAVPIIACTGIGLAIAILAHRDLRRRPSNMRRAIVAIIIGAVTAALALQLGR